MQKLLEIKRGSEGFGLLVERDAGFIDPDDPRNVKAINELNKTIDNNTNVEIVDRMKVYCVLQKFNIKNANGRIYPESVLKKQVEIYRAKINNRSAYGELNHPESVTIDGDRLAFVITDVWWEGKTLIGEIELILSPGFVKHGVISCVGDKIANYLRLHLLIGVSSRGLGSVEKDRFSGEYIVQDDFEITCWDVVCDPSTPKALLSVTYDGLKPWVESKTSKKDSIIEGLDRFLTNKTIL